MAEFSTQSAPAPLRWLKIVLGCSLAVAAVIFVVISIHWPLVGDASLIHYICFMMDHGMAPYRDLGDMNMPGSYLIEWSVMHTLGGGPFAWRIFDLSLSAAAIAAMIVVALPYDWFAGFFAGVLLLLLHGRDGIQQVGQRDYTMAVLLLLAYAFLFHAWRSGKWWATAAFGLFAGIAGNMKPTAVPWSVLLLIMTACVLKAKKQPIFRHLLTGIAGLVLPFAVVFVFLVHKDALRAFWVGLHTVVPYYASLAHRPFGYLLLHSFSPLMPLVALWLVLLAVTAFSRQTTSRDWNGWERAALVAALVFGLAGYIGQRKGFAYQRYPFLVFLLLVMGIDFAIAVRKRGMPRLLGAAGLIVGALVIAPMSTYIAGTFDWRNQEFITMLQTDLNHLGGSDLSGHVQCIDSISGCNNTLYDMRLVQQTGVLSDFLLFGPANLPVIQQTRTAFWDDIHRMPPHVIVVTSWLHTSGPDNFRKLDLWPEFKDYLGQNYSLYAERTPPHMVRWESRTLPPRSYRIYLLKEPTAK
jgi:hypothetical protein